MSRVVHEALYLLKMQVSEARVEVEPLPVIRTDPYQLRQLFQDRTNILDKPPWAHFQTCGEG